MRGRLRYAPDDEAAAENDLAVNRRTATEAGRAVTDFKEASIVVMTTMGKLSNLSLSLSLSNGQIDSITNGRNDCQPIDCKKK
jgi:hypothetical protein